MKIEQGFNKESKLRASSSATGASAASAVPQVPDPVHRPPAAHAATEPAQRRAVPGTEVTDDAFLSAYRAARKSSDTQAYPDDLERCWHAIAPPLGLPDTDDLARGLRDSVADWPAFPDAAEALQRLRRHFKLVTTTNAQAWALAHFDKTLGAPFDLLLSSDDALCEKPDPRYFAYARGRYQGAWGYRQADNLHVAQSQYHDIGIARRLGIASCWIERRHGMAGPGGTIESAHTVPDYHFHTLAQLADAVEAGR